MGFVISRPNGHQLVSWKRRLRAASIKHAKHSSYALNMKIFEQMGLKFNLERDVKQRRYRLRLKNAKSFRYVAGVSQKLCGKLSAGIMEKLSQT